MRTIGLLAAAAAAACSSGGEPVFCSARTDCARSERCASDGRCVPDLDFTRLPGTMSTDAGLVVHPDATPVAMDAGPTCPEIVVQNVGSYCTLVEALAVASDGDTVQLPPGDFTGRISLRAAIVLQGSGNAGMNRTRLTVTDGQTAIEVGAAGAEVKNLAINAPNGRAMQIAAATTVTLVNVEAAAGAGLFVLGGAQADLRTVSVTGVKRTDGFRADDGAGIVYESGTSGDVSGVVSGCAGPGISVNGADVQLSNAVVRENAQGIAVAMNGRIRAQNGVSIEMNTGVGVLSDGGRVELQNIMIHQNMGDGVRLSGASMGQLQGNSFNQNQGWGIFCAPGVDPFPCQSNTYTSNGMGTNNCPRCER